MTEPEALNTLTEALTCALNAYTQGDYEFAEGTMTEAEAKSLIPHVVQHLRNYPNLAEEYADASNDVDRQGDLIVSIIGALWEDFCPRA
jgi:hypothetical protein